MVETGVAAAAGRETARDEGLTRSLGAAALTAALVNIIVGGGIFALPGAMAAAAGPFAIFAYVLCAIATAAVMACCAEAGSRAASSGGIYGYVDAAFGPLAGFVAGVMLWVSCVLAAGGITASFAGVLASLIPALASPVARAGVIVAALGGIAAVNLVSARMAAGVISWATLVKLTPLLVFVGVGLFAVDPHKMSAGPTPTLGGLGRAMLLCLFAFQGMETVLGANGEVKEPGRTLPRALIAAMAICTTLYIAIQVAAQGLLGGALAGSATPLASAAATIDPRLGALMLVAMALSLFVWIGSDMLGSPRVLFALARDGYLPAAFGRLSGRGATPVTAIVVHAAIAIALAVTGTFEQLAVLSALSSCMLYVGACLAAWRLDRRGVRGVGEPLKLRGLPVFAVVGSLSMAAAIVLARPIEIAATVGLAAAACLGYAALRRRRRQPIR